jgi:lipopolysaccharide biosynthesis protein
MVVVLVMVLLPMESVLLMSDKTKIAVLLWLYHSDLCFSFFNYLYPLRHHIKLFLGLCKDNNNQIVIDLFTKYFNSDQLFITYHENKGADILPFIQQLSFLSYKKYPNFIKLHSKKSELSFTKKWRTELCDYYISSEKRFLTIKKLLNSKNVGSVGHPSFILQKCEFVHSDYIYQLCNHMHISIPAKRPFVAGCMFAGKTQLYQKYILPHSGYFEQLCRDETGKINDLNGPTYTHSLERVLGYIACQDNYQLCSLKEQRCIDHISLSN